MTARRRRPSTLTRQPRLRRRLHGQLHERDASRTRTSAPARRSASAGSRSAARTPATTPSTRPRRRPRTSRSGTLHGLGRRREQGVRRHHGRDRDAERRPRCRRRRSPTAYASASFANKNVGTGKPVSVTGISISGARRGQLHLTNTTATTTADITARALTVTATGVNKVYDGTTTATVTLNDNRVSGDVFTSSYTSASFADKNVGNGKPVSVTGISISGTDAGNYTFNTTASTTANITARALTVSAARREQGLRRHHGGDRRPERQPRLWRRLHGQLHERELRGQERGHRQDGLRERDLDQRRGRRQLHLQHDRDDDGEHHARSR